MESKIIEITCANKKIHFNDFVRAMKFIYYSPSKKPFIEVTVSQQDCIDQMHSSWMMEYKLYSPEMFYTINSFVTQTPSLQA